MAMFTTDYWDRFGKYVNITEEELVESGPSAKKTNGDSYSEQAGNAVSVQHGNKNSFQVGWSNTLTEGFTFSTVLGASFSTTAGASFSTTAGVAIANHLGFKFAGFAGGEASINWSRSYKVTKGSAYSWDTVEKLETTEQKVVSAQKKLEIATDVKKVINDEIGLYAKDLKTTAAGDVTWVCTSHSTTCVGDITLDSADTVNVTGGRNVCVAGGMGLVLESQGAVTISAPQKVTIGGALINIG